MRYSLLSRFRGALIGSALGDLLGANCQQLQTTSIAWMEVDRWGFRPIATETAPDAAPAGWGKLAIAQAHRLIRGELGQAPDDASLPSIVNFKLPSPMPEQPSIQQPMQQSMQQSMQSMAGMAIATLPLMLFYHDDLDQLRHHLQQVAISWQQPPAFAIGALIVGHTLSLALREQLQPDRLISQLMTALELEHSDPSWGQQLTQLQIWLTDGHEVMPQHRCGPFNPITLALYSFLNTPDTYRLSLVRAARTQYFPQETCAITGILSGGYNGVAPLPIGWRRAAYPVGQTTSALQPLWAVSSEPELVQLASQLLAVWSGVHQPTQRSWSAKSTPVTASPRMIRPR